MRSIIVLVAAMLVATVMGQTSTLAANPLLGDLDGIVHVSRDDGTVIVRNAMGLQNREFNIAMPSDARFMIGSNTKLYTTVAIYQLHEQGKLNLSGDIASMLDAADFATFGLPTQTTFCPALPNASGRCEAITMHQLMSMSSGLYPALNCDAMPVDPTECNRDVYIVNPGSLGKVVGTFINNPLVFVPGTQYMYSNPNFVLLAYFVEKYSGMKFGRYLQTFIFGPLGLKDTYFDFFDGQLGRADPKRVYEYLKFYDNATYTLLGYGPLRRELDMGAVSGTGGIISTPADEATFWRALFNRTSGGAPLLSRKTSQQSILSPWTFFGPINLPNGTSYGYYAQGILVICAEQLCPSGPAYMNYEGGTFASHTVNLYDYRPGMEGTLTQVWTSTNLYLTSAAAMSAAQAAEEGPFFPALSIASSWSAGTPAVSQLAWELMFKYGA